MFQLSHVALFFILLFPLSMFNQIKIQSVYWTCYWVDVHFPKETFTAFYSVARCIIIIWNKDFRLLLIIGIRKFQNVNINLCIYCSGTDCYLSFQFGNYWWFTFVFSACKSPFLQFSPKHCLLFLLTCFSISLVERKSIYFYFLMHAASSFLSWSFAVFFRLPVYARVLDKVPWTTNIFCRTLSFIILCIILPDSSVVGAMFPVNQPGATAR